MRNDDLNELEELSETELSPESPQSIWRTDGANIELEISETDNKENPVIVKVTSKVIEDASKAGGILGDLTKNQLETLISPNCRACCEGDRVQRRILSEWDEKFSRAEDTFSNLQERKPEEKHQIKSKEILSSTTTKQNAFEDLSKDAFGAPRSRSGRRCATVPEETKEDVVEELRPSSCRMENRCDKQVGTMKFPDRVKNRLMAVRKSEVPADACRWTKYRLEQLTDEYSNKIIERSSSTSSGYEIIVRPSGTFNRNAGPVRIFKYSLDLRHIRGKWTEELINRISMPTEASKIRSIREECLPTCRRTLGGTATRDFMCECCKRRHS